MNIMKKSLVALIALFAVQSSFGINRDRPDGAAWQPEQSAEALASQQAYQGRIDQSGRIPIRAEEQETGPMNNEKSAKSALTAAARREEATKNLVAAESRRKQPVPQKRSPWWFAILLVGIGAIGFAGAKDWMTKNVPAMPEATKRRRKMPF